MSWLPTDAIPQGGPEYLLPCPSCGKVHFAWNTDKETGHCFVCDYRLGGGRALRRAFQYGVEVDRPDVLSTPIVQDTEVFLEVWDSGEAQDYLRGRGVGEELAERCGCLYKHYRVWFPCRNIVTPTKPPIMMSRSILPDQKAWRSSKGDKSEYVFGSLPRSETVVLVEGIFDVLTPGLWGVALSTLGSSMSAGVRYAILQRYRRIFLWWDPDAEEKQQETWLALCGDHNMMQREGLVPPGAFYSISQIRGPEPGSCTPGEAKKILEGYL